MYFIEKNLTRLRNHQPTFFLDPKELKQVQSKLKKGDYSIYYPYSDSEKNIIYTNQIPRVLLYEIECKSPLRHQDILGALFSLNIDKSLFGDILLIDNHYYIYLLELVQNYFESNFLKVRNSSVTVKQIDLSFLQDYHRNYERLELIVSSLRIDTVVSSILHISRSNIDLLLKKKEIIFNYDILKDPSHKIKEGDVFSIKRVGKFKFQGIIKNTKSNHFIIEILKYL